MALDGQTFRLTSITPRTGPEPVFNLEVANEHTYYVSSDGLLVHNAVPKIYLTKAGRQGKLAKKTTAKHKNIQRAKTGPKPGMIGPHNQTIAIWGNFLKAGGATIISGGKVVSERLLPMAKGAFKNGRRPDIHARLSNGTELIVQVGKVNSKGIPVPRELKAMHDFILSGYKVIFIPYN